LTSLSDMACPYHPQLALGIMWVSKPLTSTANQKNH